MKSWREYLLIALIVLLPFSLTAFLVYQGEWFFFDQSLYVLVGREFWIGETIYVDFWDHHPPLMYILTGALSFIAGQTHIVYLIFTGISLVALWYLLWQFLKELKLEKYLLVSTLLFSIFSTAFLYAQWNTEQVYAPLLACIALWLFRLWKKYPDTAVFGADTLWKIGITASILLFLKVQAWIEMIGLFVITAILMAPKKIQQIVVTALVVSAISIIPTMIFMYFYGNGFWHNFESIFLYNFQYIDSPSESSAGKSLIITTLKGVVVVWLFIWLWMKSKKSEVFKKEGIFLLLWFVVSLFASTLSGRLYPHYFIQFIVPATLLIIFVWHWYRESLTLPRYFALVGVGIALVFYALFSQVNQSTLREGDRISEGLAVVFSNIFKTDVSYRDRIACRAFDAPYYCTEAIYKIRELVPPGSRIFSITTEPGIAIDLQSRLVGPYLSDIHAATGLAGDWRRNLSQAEFILLDSESTRYFDTKVYADEYCRQIWNKERLSLYSCLPE